MKNIILLLLILTRLCFSQCDCDYTIPFNSHPDGEALGIKPGDRVCLDGPVVLTVNGNLKAVLIKAKEYEKVVNALAMLKLMINADNDVKEGKFREATSFFKEFRREKGIPR